MKKQNIQGEKRQRFSIRKLTIGTCSLLIGAYFLGSAPMVAAAENPQPEAKSELVIAKNENASTSVGDNNQTVKPMDKTVEKTENQVSKQEENAAVTNINSSTVVANDAGKETIHKENVETKEKTEIVGVKTDKVEKNTTPVETSNSTIPNTATKQEVTTPIQPAAPTTEKSASSTEKETTTQAKTIEWESVSKVKGTVKEVAEDGVRYNQLSSTTANNNSDKEALFEKQGLKGDEDGTVNIDLWFYERSEVE